MTTPRQAPPNETPEQRKERLGAAYAFQRRLDAERQAELDAQQRARTASLMDSLSSRLPMPVPAAPTGGLSAAVQPMGGLTAATTAAQPTFDDDDYTGRMGPGGEPERYSTMSGGDPRLAQQREIERQQQRLKEPVTIRSWMTTNKKDVRGTKPADNITLQPGKQYQIIDFTGKNDGEVIASGSTPEEFLRIQDIAENLASKGRRADWRLQEVSDEPSNSKFGSALEPTTGKYITTLGGDLYNKSGWSTVADIAKIAAPIALQFVPGFGQALGLKLGLKGLAAKAAGIGLTSAAGRAGAGVATGEKLGDALKAGAISGLASGATAGILGGLSSPTPGMTPIPAGALPGAPMSVIPADVLAQASRIPASAFSGLGSVASDVGKEIVVNAAKNAATSGLSNLASGAISAGIGAGTGALATAAPPPSQPQPGGEPEAVVTGSLIPKAGLDSVLAGGAPAIANIVGAQEVLGNQPSSVEEEAVVTGKRIDDPNLGGALAAATGAVIPNQPPPTFPGDDPLQTVSQDRNKDLDIGGALPAATGAVISNQPPPTVSGDDPLQTVSQDRNKDLDITAPFSVAASAVPDLTKPGTDTKGDNTGDKKKDTLDKIADAATIAGLVIPAIAAITGGGKGGGGTGTYTSGSDALNKVFTDKLPTPGQDGAFMVGGLGPPTGPNPMAVRPTADWYRYATGPAMDMPRGVDLNKATSPYAGFGPGTLGEKTFERVTTGMARGGPMGYSRGSSRKSFAVEGPGDGRSDDIPAVLSDGEYVIDAETVALLGDGSSRAGAKKLDELRVKIRKHKGRNLAKGKFSVNAKPLEAYMRGGRI